MNTITGHVHPRPERCTIEVDVPLARRWQARPTVPQFGTVGAQTDERNPATGLIVDTASTAKEYVLGAKSCLSTRR